MRFHFTTRSLLAATTILGLLLGGLLLVKRLNAIDPDTLEVEVCGAVTDLPWEDCEWTPGKHGICIELSNQLVPPAELESNLELNQLLLVVKYENGLGICDFLGFIQIKDHDKVLSLRHDLSVGGAGGKDAAVTCRPSFDVDKRALRLDLTTWVNSKLIAKKCTLEFVFDGERFVLKRSD